MRASQPTTTGNLAELLGKNAFILSDSGKRDILYYLAKPKMSQNVYE